MCIHRMKIVHRDLKSANCLVNKHWTVKICDFGLSRIMTETPMKDSASAGTPEWMAPELIRNEPFSEKCDIFSLGVIMWELCTLNRPWEGVPPERVYADIRYFTFTSNQSFHYIYFITIFILQELYSNSKSIKHDTYAVQVVYAVANEGSRLEIPDGPLGRLISG